MGFSRRKSATKFLCVKTFSGKVVRQTGMTYGRLFHAVSPYRIQNFTVRPTSLYS